MLENKIMSISPQLCFPHWATSKCMCNCVLIQTMSYLTDLCYPIHFNAEGDTKCLLNFRLAEGGKFPSPIYSYADEHFHKNLIMKLHVICKLRII